MLAGLPEWFIRQLRHVGLLPEAAKKDRIMTNYPDQAKDSTQPPAVSSPQQTDPWDKWREMLDGYFAEYSAPWNIRELRDVILYPRLASESHEDVVCMLLVAINRLESLPGVGIDPSSTP